MCGESARVFERRDGFLGGAAPRFDTGAKPQRVCSTEPIAASGRDAQGAIACGVALVHVAGGACNFCRRRRETLPEQCDSQPVGDRESLRHGGARIVQSTALRVQLGEVVECAGDSGVVAGFAQRPHAQPKALARILYISHDGRDGAEIQLHVRKERMIAGRDGVERCIIVLSSCRGEVASSLGNACETRLGPGDADRVANELRCLEPAPKERFRLTG